ncbi:hypothetical protein MD484_g8718, partial [Candolleomyces efflorescens]
MQGSQPESALWHLDYLHNIASFASWTTLQSWCRLKEPARSVAKAEIRRRCNEVVSRFIPRDRIQEFWEKLRASKAVITGSVVRELMLINIKEVIPFDLNILHRLYEKDELHALFLSMGYTSSSRVPGEDYESTIASVEQYEKETTEGVVSV